MNGVWRCSCNETSKRSILVFACIGRVGCGACVSVHASVRVCVARARSVIAALVFFSAAGFVFFEQSPFVPLWFAATLAPVEPGCQRCSLWGLVGSWRASGAASRNAPRCGAAPCAVGMADRPSPLFCRYWCSKQHLVECVRCTWVRGAAVCSFLECLGARGVPSVRVR
jgi:hypothetical protein